MMRIVLSHLLQTIRVWKHREWLDQEKYPQLMQMHLKDWVARNFEKAMQSVRQIPISSEYWQTFQNLPAAQLIVLTAALKISQNAHSFNFEAVYNEYTSFLAGHEKQLGAIGEISRSLFIKLFLDLCDKGFLVSTSDCDPLNVNNKISMGFRREDLQSQILKS